MMFRSGLHAVVASSSGRVHDLAGFPDMWAFEKKYAQP